MPDIEGRMTREIVGACAWCGRPSMETGYAKGLGREVPLHPLCGAAIVYAYHRWQRGIPQRNALGAQRATALFGPAPAQLTAGS